MSLPSAFAPSLSSEPFSSDWLLLSLVSVGECGYSYVVRGASVCVWVGVGMCVNAYVQIRMLCICVYKEGRKRREGKERHAEKREQRKKGGMGVMVPAAVGTTTGLGFGLVMIGLIVMMKEMAERDSEWDKISMWRMNKMRLYTEIRKKIGNKKKTENKMTMKVRNEITQT